MEDAYGTMVITAPYDCSPVLSEDACTQLYRRVVLICLLLLAREGHIGAYAIFVYRNIYVYEWRASRHCKISCERILEHCHFMSICMIADILVLQCEKWMATKRKI